MIQGPVNHPIERSLHWSLIHTSPCLQDRLPCPAASLIVRRADDMQHILNTTLLAACCVTCYKWQQLLDRGQRYRVQTQVAHLGSTTWAERTASLPVHRRDMCCPERQIDRQSAMSSWCMFCSVGQAIVYHLSDLKGMSMWPDKFGVVGLSQSATQAAVRVVGSFMLKARELQQLVIVQRVWFLAVKTEITLPTIGST